MKKFFIFLFFLSTILFLFLYNKKDMSVLLNDIQDEYAAISKYYIYEIKLVFKNLDLELSYDINYADNKFFVSSYINDGIYLDDIPIGDYYVFIKVIYNNGVKYYSLMNQTTYDNVSYYTVTHNNKNNLIKFNFDKSQKFLMVNVSSLNVLDNYYDVVIDPGHGGEDPGASFSNYSEAILNLEIALKLKKKFDSIGLRSILTRVDDTYPSAYGNNSRTSLPYDVNAKFFISIHLNSSDVKMTYGGVEVYAPNNCKLDFASSLASNIVSSANTSYSRNEAFRVSRGVYVRTFTNDDVKSSVSEARLKGYKPYPINTDTNYYFMIRETGGIATGAYIDGRNKDVGKNNYYLSNIGAESYLIELGYINYWPDLNKLVDDQDDYVNGIVKAFEEKIK